MDERSHRPAGGVPVPPRTLSRVSGPGILVCDKCGRSYKGKRAPVHARVLRKRISRGRSSITYLAVGESWRPGCTEETLPVSRVQFQAIDRDSSIGIELHRGWLGLRWYGRISIP